MSQPGWARFFLKPQNNQECIKAKADELQKLLDFDVYMEVDDKGQDCISTTMGHYQEQRTKGG